MNPLFRIDFSISDSLKIVRKSVLIYETIIKANAEAQGKKFFEGRPQKFSKEQKEHALKLLENYSYTEVVKMTGISKSTLIRYRSKM